MKEQKLEKLSDKDIVLYALYILGGWQKRVHTEDIALKCHELAPRKFSWVKYHSTKSVPTRFALETAKKPKYGALVKGGSERKRTVRSVRGWMLTSEGVKWIKLHKQRIEQYLGTHEPTGERLAADRKLKALLKSAAFEKFTGYGKQVEISHAESPNHSYVL
mgnify:CR=1 FL=1